jgi:hypothetical protein
MTRYGSKQNSWNGHDLGFASKVCFAEMHMPESKHTTRGALVNILQSMDNTSFCNSTGWYCGRIVLKSEGKKQYKSAGASASRKWAVADFKAAVCSEWPLCFAHDEVALDVYAGVR